MSVSVRIRVGGGGWHLATKSFNDAEGSNLKLTLYVTKSHNYTDIVWHTVNHPGPNRRFYRQFLSKL